MQRSLSVILCITLGWDLFVQPATAKDPVDWAAMTVPDDPPMQYKGDVSQSLLAVHISSVVSKTVFA